MKISSIIWQLICAMNLFYVSYIKLNIVLRTDDEFSSVIIHSVYLLFLAMYFIFSGYGLIQNKDWGYKHSYIANLLFIIIILTIFGTTVVMGLSEPEVLIYAINIQIPSLIAGAISLMFFFNLKGAYNKSLKQDK